MYTYIIILTRSETFTQYITPKRKTKSDEVSYIQNKKPDYKMSKFKLIENDMKKHMSLSINAQN